MAYNMYPESEIALRNRIRQILLDQISMTGGYMHLANRRVKKHGGVESHRQHLRAAKHNPFIEFEQAHHMNAHQAAPLYHHMGGNYDIGGAYAGGYRRKHRRHHGSAMAGGVKMIRNKRGKLVSAARSAAGKRAAKHNPMIQAKIRHAHGGYGTSKGARKAWKTRHKKGGARLSRNALLNSAHEFY